MQSQTGKQIIAIHVFPNISKSKDNQAMKFGRLIEYNMIKILLEKSYTKYFQDKDLNILTTKRLFKIKYMSF